MAWTVNTGASYHQQDTSYYCGAACAQMVLDSIGGGLVDQDTLYTSNHNHNTQGGWATDPHGLSYTLNAYGNAHGKYFAAYTNDTEADGSHQIVHTLRVYDVAPVALVEGCAHWIVVRGASTDVDPASGPYSINGFWVNNPWPPTPSPGPPPPHQDGTDGCGTGGTGGVRGIADEYAAYSSMWQSTYFTGCDVWGVGHAQFVSVCDPTPPKIGPLVVKREPYPFRGERFIAQEEVVELAVSSVDRHGLRENPLFARAIERARSFRSVLVQRLDLPDTYYYLVEVGETPESISAILAVDALYGEFQGGHAWEEPLRQLWPSAEEVEDRIVSKRFDLGEERNRLIVRPGAFCVYPILVWRPCRESRSPYYPFRMVTIGSQQLFIARDGTVYTELHDINPGG
jgi:hypothetical protein